MVENGCKSFSNIQKYITKAGSMRTNEPGKEQIKSSGRAETLFSDFRRRVLALLPLRPEGISMPGKFPG
jgi:hypothetical protein